MPAAVEARPVFPPILAVALTFGIPKRIIAIMNATVLCLLNIFASIRVYFYELKDNLPRLQPFMKRALDIYPFHARQFVRIVA